MGFFFFFLRLCVCVCLGLPFSCGVRMESWVSHMQNTASALTTLPALREFLLSLKIDFTGCLPYELDSVLYLVMWW